MSRPLALPMDLPRAAEPLPRPGRRGIQGRLDDAGANHRGYWCPKGHRFSLRVTDAEDAMGRLRRTRPCPVCNGLDTGAPTEDGAVYRHVDGRSEEARQAASKAQMERLKDWAGELP